MKKKKVDKKEMEKLKVSICEHKIDIIKDTIEEYKEALVELDFPRMALLKIRYENYFNNAIEKHPEVLKKRMHNIFGGPRLSPLEFAESNLKYWEKREKEIERWINGIPHDKKMEYVDKALDKFKLYMDFMSDVMREHRIADTAKLRKNHKVHKEHINDDLEAVYLCNQAVKPTNLMMTDDWKKVTCKNCLRRKKK